LHNKKNLLFTAKGEWLTRILIKVRKRAQHQNRKSIELVAKTRELKRETKEDETNESSG
jgi:hypothetical protein